MVIYMIDAKLKTLIMVDKLKNYSKTAYALGLTQPAVSTHIRQLEEEFNIKIFNKTEKELILTNEGAILLRFAKRIETLYSFVYEAIENEKKHIKSLTIGMSHTAENSDIPKLLANYTSQNNDSKLVNNIKIISDSIKNIYNKLKAYEIDLAIVEGRFPDHDFNTVLLDTDSLVLIVVLSLFVYRNGTIGYIVKLGEFWKNKDDSFVNYKKNSDFCKTYLLIIRNLKSKGK